MSQLSKEEFVKTLNSLRDMLWYQDDLNKFFDDHCSVTSDWISGYTFSEPLIEQALVDTLTIMFDDNEVQKPNIQSSLRYHQT